MDKVLLDTDILSEILKARNRQVVAKAITYQTIYDQYTISTITVMEIVKGFHKIKQETQLQQFLAGLPYLEVLTLDTLSAEIAGRIYADLQRTGQTIGRADPMIAAIAIRYRLPLVTGNVKHYHRVVELGYTLHLDNWRT